MKLVLSSLMVLFSFAAFAQDAALSKPLSISFDQVEKASTLQELVPECFGELKDIKSYKITLAISRQKLNEIQSNGNSVSPKFKELVLAQRNSDKQILVYFEDIRYGTDKTYLSPEKIVTVK